MMLSHVYTMALAAQYSFPLEQLGAVLLPLSLALAGDSCETGAGFVTVKR